MIKKYLQTVESLTSFLRPKKNMSSGTKAVSPVACVAGVERPATQAIPPANPRPILPHLIRSHF